MLDTHIAVAMYEGKIGSLSSQAKRALDRDPASVSPAVLLELELLHEIGRLRVRARSIAQFLERSLDIRIARESFVDVASSALEYGFTRDPFDRLIVAHAGLLNATLVTLDGQLQQFYPHTLA